MLWGREGERTWLQDRVPGRQPVVVVGPAGIGKTSLATDVLAGAGSVVAVGALASLRAVAFHPFRPRFGDELGDRASVIANQVLDAGADAVLLDDFQWADEPSLAVADLLVGRLPLLATVRSDDPGSEVVLGALAAAGFERLDLGGLHERPARALAAARHPDLDDVALDRVVLGAGGNPLLLAELANVDDPSPTLTRAMEQRLAGLAPEVRTAMERLSVLGRPAEAGLLGPGATELVASGFARLDGRRVVVHHGLLAEVVVEQLGERARDVRRDLARLVDDGEGARLLASAGDRGDARSRALAGARAARSTPERGSLLALAVSLAPADELDLANRVRTVPILVAVGQLDLAEPLTRVPPALAGRLTPVERGTMAGLAAEVAWHRGQIEAVQDAVAESLAALEGTGTGAEVRALAASIVLDWKDGTYAPGALEHARQAVELADRLGVDETFARSRLATVLFALGEPGWEELYRQVLADTDETCDDALAAVAVERLVLAHWVSGDALEAERTAIELVDRGPRYDHDPAWAGLVAYRAMLGVLLGRDRRSLLEQWTPVLDREPIFRLRPFLHAALALATLDLGATTDAAQRVADAVDECGDADAASRSLLDWVAADAAWSSDRREDAMAAAGHAGALGVGDYPPAVMARILGGHAALVGGRAPTGPAPRDLLAGWAAAPVEWQALVDAAAGRAADAADGFALAADGWRDRDVRSEGRCRWAAGEWAQRAGRSDAEQRLLAAQDLADRTGQAPLAARVRRSLRALGVRRTARRGQSVTGLTTREEEVLDLVGTGATSAEIAAVLDIAVSTVDSLVRSAVHKLGAPNRRSAAAQLRRGRTGA